jgi:hypothetical protein
MSWQSMFGEADKEFKEGIAQYYTHLVTAKLSHKYPEFHDAYKKLLELQVGPYRCHEAWIEKYQPEAIRRALIETRRCTELGRRDAFESRLNQAAVTLGTVTIG